MGGMKSMDWTVNRFWQKVEKTDDCWIWKRRRDQDGYGTLTVQKVKTRAHRFSFEMNVGPIPPGQHVLHTCDNPSCVRPDHLFLGSNLNNVQDRVSKKRGPIGTRNRHARLTEEDVKVMRARFAEGERIIDIARDYPVHESSVGYAINGQTWRHLS